MKTRIDGSECSAPPADPVCESCGTTFRCGAKDSTCWCFEIAVESAALRELSEQFSGCICRRCLLKLAEKE